MERSVKLTFAILFFFIGNLLAQEKEVITKEKAISLALEFNYGIKIAENEVEIAENNKGILNSGYLPTLTGRAGAGYDLNDRLTEPEDGEPLQQDGIENNSYNASVNLNYTLFDGLGRLYNYKSLKEEYQLSKLQARETIENTMLQLLAVYYEIARLTENVAVLKDVLETSKDRVTRAQYQFDFGQSNNLAVLNARVDVNNDSVNLLQTRQQLSNTKRDLNVLLDRQMTHKDFSVDTTVSFIPKLQLDSYVADAEVNNVSLLQLDKSLEITAYDIKISKSGYLPTIDLSGSYGWNYNRSAATAFFPGSRQTTDGISGGVSLNWNLFDGGATSLRVQNAKINHENQQLQKKQLSLGIRRDIANALGNYENRLYIYKVQKENVRTNEDNFERSREQFKLGRITSIEFRQAQVNLLDARTSLSLAKYDAKLAELSLLQLTGQLLNVEL
ncbi:TolC family protein [Salegentibacter maritimus]|uniref:TolC family protein n=1 Tax=Salegentibacter maritimus TaxID=2794347 RepID=A0ABS0TDP4_9FLAO|nr:TolC family protein [Salegentibacter maritimus]MBI6115535.1 TolC family protein [Salegentibacter maritimus]MBI6119160.1 TolC family protein [Salegentibacter maritimus]